MTKQLIKCLECGLDRIQKIVGDIVLKRGTIPNVPYEKCSNCGETFLSPESYEVIEKYEDQISTFVPPSSSNSQKYALLI